MYKRFKWDETIRFDQTSFFKLPDKPSRIFVGSTMELFGDWVKPEWLNTILTICRQHKEHTFIFLTKQPQNLPKELPDNCWVGVSATNSKMFISNVYILSHVKAGKRFVSFEPLLGDISENCGLSLDYVLEDAGINWLIIGQQTPVKISAMPKVGWVEEIVTAADTASIPVFLKDNLISCVDQYPFAFSGKFPDIKLRQELPIVKE
jgi:protein gp37